MILSKKLCCHIKVGNLYRLEEIGSVTKNGDNYKFLSKMKMYIIPLFYLHVAIF